MPVAVTVAACRRWDILADVDAGGLAVQRHDLRPAEDVDAALHAQGPDQRLNDSLAAENTKPPMLLVGEMRPTPRLPSPW